MINSISFCYEIVNIINSITIDTNSIIFQLILVSLEPVILV